MVTNSKPTVSPLDEKKVHFGIRLNKVDKPLRDQEIKDIMTKNPDVTSKEIEKNYVFKNSDGLLVGISSRQVDRIRVEWKEERANISKQQEKFGTFFLPKTISLWQKFPNGLWGYPEAPEAINVYLRTITAKSRPRDYHFIRRLLDGIHGLHWSLWDSNIEKIHYWIDEEYDTHGLALKEKTKALGQVQTIRRFLKWYGWTMNNIEKYFPHPRKLKPLRTRLGNAELLYFYPREQWDNYMATIEETMNDLPNYTNKSKFNQVIYAEGFKLFCWIASDTATRHGFGHDVNNGKDWGMGILGIRIPNIYYNYKRIQGYTDLFLQDKKNYFWHKVIQPSTTVLLKKYLKLHAEFYPDMSDMLFPSNSRAKRLRLKIIDQKLPLWNANVTTYLFDQVNQRFWHKYKIAKGNSNRRVEGKHPVTWKTHEFRHNFAVWSILMGLDINTTCKRGGWNNPQTFMETYVDIVPEFEDSQMVLSFGDVNARQQLEKEGRFLTHASIQKKAFAED